VAKVEALLAASRLITLVGGGGLGKTRLAVEVGVRTEALFAAGAAFVPLAALSDPLLLPAHVASLLGLETQGEGSTLEALGSYLGEADLLLVLDNCEHLVDASADLAQGLLARCPRLRILATSRQRLGVTGECVWKIPSLPVPETEPVGDEEWTTWLREVPAARLLLERIEMIRPGYRVERREEARALAQICRRLDGIPLALELAAARAGHLPPEQIAARLDDRFRLLSGGTRGTLPRHRTLRTLVDWSYDLLTAPQRLLLSRLAVFSGGWTLEAAETVCAGPIATETSVELLPAEEVFELIAALVEQSLVQLEQHDGLPRYTWLETLREYALERLQASGEAHGVANRHRDYFLSFAETAEAAFDGPEQIQWLDRLQQEYGNLRAAIHHSRHAVDGATAGLRLTTALWRFWALRSNAREGYEQVCSALARELPEHDAVARSLRARALMAAGVLALDHGNSGAALPLMEESLEIYRELGDPVGLSRARTGLGNVAMVNDLPASARVHYDAALRISRATGNRTTEGVCLSNLGSAAQAEGDYQEAQRYYREALTLAREVGDPARIGATTVYLGVSTMLTGDLAAAAALHAEATEILRPHGLSRRLVEAIELGAALAGAREEHGRAVCLYSAVTALRGLGQFSPEFTWTHQAEVALAVAARALGLDGCAVAAVKGNGMSLEAALRLSCGAPELE
jgi:non-specific serine/threonine protein kinase